ncbi:MAG: methyltransferase domain-containing protein [candidate division Zixibacteria bacterium]|nr:methyltransferase domain-containing protein [candidate division Zixibacteria bacterium]NIR64356.1 methyltransferase domain-containing protein [candidate division Zixibacteria bacterium]NIS16310.1 methyltransferase domain-containing protein [candidate division Zixibacteria bacterium]NIS46284.1 methyltransferase domain-containing protein [candidate division Zixibacteria bacterium]NIT54492.1 methyltransferase domain-containing protein [candidate division Zixibacteria bacterium]
MTNPKMEANTLLDPFVPAMAAWALVSGVSTGLFEAVANGKHRSDDIAKHLDLDSDGIKRLLDILSCLGYIKSRDGDYDLTEVSRNTLLENSSHKLKNWVRFCRIQLQALEQLESTLTGGNCVDLQALMEKPDGLYIHQLAMAETAAPAADWIAENIPVQKGSRLMLDIGGSHGIYSSAISRMNPQMRAEVLELPNVIETARNVARDLGTDDLVTHIEGDILKTELRNDYDLVFMSNLIHHIPEELLIRVIRQIYNHINPGGTIAIWDFSEAEGEPELVSSAFSLFFYMTSKARCYSLEEIEQLLSDAGFAHFSAIRPPAPSPHALYIARRP